MRFKRKIDKQCRIVIPNDIRRILSIEPRTELTLYLEDGRLIIVKSENERTAKTNGKNDVAMLAERKL